MSFGAYGKATGGYLLASDRNGTLYIGVTSNLWRGFGAKHDVMKLVWYEQHAMMDVAITGEKHLKKWNRDWKVRLMQESNPYWNDLRPAIVG